MLVAQGFKKFEHRARGFDTVLREAEQTLPVDDRIFMLLDPSRRQRGDTQNFCRFVFAAQQAGGDVVRLRIPSEFEIASHQYFVGLVGHSAFTSRLFRICDGAFVIAQLGLHAREQHAMPAVCRIRAQDRVHATRCSTKIACAPCRFNGGNRIDARAHRQWSRRTDALDEVIHIPVIEKPFSEFSRVMSQVAPALFQRVYLPEFQHGRRGIVATHTEARGARLHQFNQLMPLLNQVAVGRFGIDVRNEYELVVADDLGDLRHLPLHFFIGLHAPDDAREQIAVLGRQSAEHRIGVEPRAAFRLLLDRRHRPERARPAAVGEEITEIAPRVIRLDGVTIRRQQLARRQLDYIHIRRNIRLFQLGRGHVRPERQPPNVGRHRLRAEHEAQLLEHFCAAVHESIVAQRMRLDGVTRHALAERTVNTACTDRGNQQL
ncbi:hypothetical protein [Caballeronia sp. GAFFF3]|uniref:hypothetical protein n=1 Tax=Caballeronia sp. GAFFF3 TaxID=2921759 RepID=UPI0020293DE6|nr:hypothetical protein [Caballeronia sp. GAFFF3]